MLWNLSRSPHIPVFVGDYLFDCIAEEARFEII